MGYVIWGHGGLDDTQANMEWCALAPGTTMQFYADLGQYLLQDSKTTFDFPANISQPWPPIDSTGVVPNLHLEPFSQQELDGFMRRNPTWGGHTLLLVGREIPVTEAVLCTGTPATCPTDPRMITGEVGGPRAHGEACKGLLKKYAGQELHWLACTGVEATEAAQRPLQIDENDPYAPYLELLRDNPDGFATWFDALTSDQIDSMLAEPQIAAWHRARMVAIARGDAPQDVLLGEDPDDPVANTFLSDGNTMVADGRNVLQNQPDAFPAWFDSQSADDQDLLLRHPLIAAWHEQRPAG